MNWAKRYFIQSQTLGYDIVHVRSIWSRSLYVLSIDENPEEAPDFQVWNNRNKARVLEGGNATEASPKKNSRISL